MKRHIFSETLRHDSFVRSFDEFPDAVLTDGSQSMREQSETHDRGCGRMSQEREMNSDGLTVAERRLAEVIGPCERRYRAAARRLRLRRWMRPDQSLRRWLAARTRRNVSTINRIARSSDAIG